MLKGRWWVGNESKLELQGVEGTEETVEETPGVAENYDTNWLCLLTSPILAMS